MKGKEASQISWAAVTEGVAAARVEAHRMRHLLNRALRLVKNSKMKDHLYQVAGDIIAGLPQRLDAVEHSLDRTSYLLSAMGKEELRNRLTSSDRAFADDALTGTPPYSPMSIKASTNRVVRRYLKGAKGGS